MSNFRCIGIRLVASHLFTNDSNGENVDKFASLKLGCGINKSRKMSAPVVTKGHVYFGTEDCTPKENSIVVQQQSPGFIQIHLGFLQYHHIYNLCVEIPKSFLLGFDLKAILDAAERSPPNINCKVISIEEKRDLFLFSVEFHAEKERLVQERLKFVLDKDVEMILEFNARVLGVGKGTPLLKNGIKCVGILNDEMSEASDWQM